MDQLLAAADLASGSGQLAAAVKEWAVAAELEKVAAGKEWAVAVELEKVAVVLERKE